MVAGEVALVSNTWQATITGGTTAEVVRRQPDGTWRLIIDDPAFIQT